MELDISFNWVRERMAAACARAGRAADSVTLLAVSKGHPPEVVQAAAQAGQALFGESKVQEAKAKIGLCPGHLRWQLVGHLQTNKCRDAVRLFEMIQSVDSVRLALEIEKWCEQSGKTMPVLLEVNLAGESSKFGFKPEEVVQVLAELNALPKIELHGLMTIAPWTTEPEKVRPIFRKLRELKTDCEQKLGAPLQHLSMGMSGDYEVAIEEGATLIRLGTVLFGERRRLHLPRTASDDGP